MQAQDYPGALWAIGLRLPDVTESDIQQAIADRTILRTWPLRGTLHFVAAADVRWMLELVGPRMIAGSARRCQQLELDDGIFARSKQLLLRALEGGKSLTRPELFALLERSRISTSGQRGIHILWRLAQEGILCFAAHAGKQPTFALLEEWAPKAKKLERDEALAALAQRYFISHGPATLQDFSWWSGLRISDAKAGIAMVASQLAQIISDGTVYWMSHDSGDARNASGAVHLLPGFDEYLLGYKDRNAVLDPRHAAEITPGKNGMFLSTVVQSGQVVGTWKRTFKKNSVILATSLFHSPKKIEARAFVAAIERYGHFSGMPVEFHLQGAFAFTSGISSSPTR